MYVTERQMWVLRYLAKRERSTAGSWVSPTEIGREVRMIHLGVARQTRSSAWACQKLAALERLGLVARSARGHYRATSQGRALAERS